MSRPNAADDHPCRGYGAHLLDDGRACFRLWAPDAGQVELLLHGTARPMWREDGGDHVLVAGAAAGDRYAYRVDGRRVPDPASRLQPDGVHGDSAVDDPAAYDWRHRDWRGRPWREAVICELHAGAMGGFDGVRRALPRLAACGYTALELMPVAAFDGARNWGYDGVLPYAPHPAYGTPTALRALVDEAHGLGLMVLLDVVYNHFGPSGNELPRYASGFFRADRPTAWGSAIDFRRPQVARYFVDNALMWLRDYHLDGLRLDAVHAIEPRGFLEHLAAEVRRACAGREAHLVLENEHNDAGLLRGGYDAQWNDDAHNALHVLLTGEREGYYADFAADPTAALATALGEGFVFQGQRDRRGVARGEPAAGLPPEAFVLFLQNHDQVGNRPLGERLTALADPRDLRAATALVALCPMVPLFFMGEECGCTTPFLYFTDYDGELAGQVREGRRAEFAQFAGFADPARRARIPDPNAPRSFAGSIPAVDDPVAAARHAQWFAHLLSLRKARVGMQAGAAHALGCRVLAERALHARWRLADGSRWELALNLSDRDVVLPGDAAAGVVHGEPADAFLPAQRLLRPHALVALAEAR
ncbi:malto-oligosyltrehalose trehalohydrolase [Fulvimonas sp. R45]|uniref:malto-oligosyltrehalose trehalohydrolase n=1 Tax=Fulvimonas sp. R45 TaxID=3045937 RepID=UPI00265F65B2|nr:malto-oligosyltrehalose trehalohydrolase [Fulvimonas sp. R45]MDO1528805.1 malto-oligosyltrehalose trehalohydrolase [Fulvimonas sp. R45]